jgi:hypothetical protein
LPELCSRCLTKSFARRAGTVHIAGVTPHPNGKFMAQVARNLTDRVDVTRTAIQAPNPNFPLSILGLPGACTQYANADVIIGPAVVAGGPGS